MVTLIGQVWCYDERVNGCVTVEGHLPRVATGGGYDMGGASKFSGGYVNNASLENAPSAMQLFSRSTSIGGVFVVDFPWDPIQDLRMGGPVNLPKTRAASVAGSGQAPRYLHIRVPGPLKFVSISTMTNGPSYWILWVDINAAPGFQGDQNNAAYRWGRSPNGCFWFAVGRGGQAPAARKVPGFGGLAGRAGSG
jgi:hypothetical protein